MPLALKQIWWVKLAIWYALPLLWQYMVLSIARHVFGAEEPTENGFSSGVAMGGVGMAIYCFAPIVMSVVFPYLIPRLGTRKIWFLSLLVGGFGFVAFQLTESLTVIFLLCFLIGIGYSGIVTMPYMMLARVVPEERVGVYMGLLNSFICIPQIVSMLTVPFYYDALLKGDPRNALLVAGVFWLIAGFLVLRITKNCLEL